MAATDTAASGAFEQAIDRDRSVSLWLITVIGLVFCMIVVGGATRLTGSGLSITEWQPIMGAIPPLNSADWQVAFDKYRQIPQYQLINKGMSLSEFKLIFFWEWFHRLLGRLIGVAFALPLAWFWWKGRLRPGLGKPLLGILALGAVQGGVGWYMVASGLVDRVSVSQYRLAMHLTLAFLILGALVWMLLEVNRLSRLPAGSISLTQSSKGAGAAPSRGKVELVAWLLLALLVLQLIAGALVAGMKAGLAYNTWPLMDGALIPSGLMIMQPWWLNPFENALTVQFNHRLLAYLILGVAGWHAWRLSAAGRPAAVSAQMLLAAIVLQAVLGIVTLLAHVPLSLGLIHQGGAAIVFAIAVWHAHAIIHGEGRG
jgi:cytochrome c oxidase assembly protein subunit 15